MDAVSAEKTLLVADARMTKTVTASASANVLIPVEHVQFILYVFISRDVFCTFSVSNVK